MSARRERRELAGSTTHGSLQTEPSLRALHASYEDSSDGLPKQYSEGNPSKSHEIKRGSKNNDYWPSPMEFGPNYQHNLAGNRHFKKGGQAAAKGDWIQGAINHPGALRKALHVPKGQKIGMPKLEKASHAKSPLMRKRATLALTLTGFHNKG